MNRCHLIFTLAALANLLVQPACKGPGAGEASSVAQSKTDNVLKAVDRSCADKKFSAAEALLRSSIADVEHSQARQDQIATGIYHRRLAQVLSEQGRYADAENEASVAYESLHGLFQPIEKYPTSDEQVARAAWVLGEVRLILRHPAEAEDILKEAAVWFEGIDPASADTSILIGLTGDCLAQLGRYEEAEDAIVQSYVRLKKMLGDNAPETLDAFQRVLFLYQAWERPDKVDEYLGSSILTGGSP